MRRIALLLSCVLAACGPQAAPTPDIPATVQWDSATAVEARSVVERGINSFMQMDVEGVKSVFSQDWTSPSYETDLENKPIRMATRDDAIKYTEDIVVAVKKMNATLSVDIKNIDCRGTSALAYCALDHEVTATVPGGKPMTQPGRATVVLAKGAEGWKWVHWHSSPGPAATASAGK